MGHFSEFYQHHFTANCRECSRTRRINHICSQEQIGKLKVKISIASSFTLMQIKFFDFDVNFRIFMQDISLGVALGSATQISMFVVRLK